MQNYFTLYTLFIKGDTKFWLVVLDKYKKLQTRHKGLTLILKCKSALCVVFLWDVNTKFLRDFYFFLFQRKNDKFPLFKSLPISSVYHPTLPSLSARYLLILKNQGWATYICLWTRSIFWDPEQIKQNSRKSFSVFPSLRFKHCSLQVQTLHILGLVNTTLCPSE